MKPAPDRRAAEPWNAQARRAAVKSAVPGLRFPALPGRQGAAMLALQYQYARSEWAPPAEIRERQFAQIGRLLDHCLDAVPFHAERLARTGYRRGAAVDGDLWRRIPVLTRSEVQDAGEALWSSRDPEGHGERVGFESSGSTGRPVSGVQTELARLFFDSITLRDHLWQKRDLAARLGVIRYPDSVALTEGRASAPGWNAASASAFENGPSFLFDVNRPVSEQIDWLFDVRPDYLLANPTLLRELVCETVRRGARPDWLRGVATHGEVLDGGLRELVMAQWRLAIADIYSAMEIGYIALQCPQGTNYHVQSEVCLVEILDEHGRECGPGEIGRVVVTPLYNFAMPLLRYALGDFAEAGAPCACGRGLPVLSRILGRERNMVRKADGELYWPEFEDAFLAARGIVRQFQVVEVAPLDLEARVVAPRALSTDEEQSVRAALQGVFGREFRVAFRHVDAISRGRTGKYEDFISMVQR